MTVLVLFATTALCVPGSTSAQAADSSGGARIRTVGTAVQHVQPNRAVVRLNFFAEGRSTKEAGRRLAARADSLRRALIGIGIPRDSLTTASDWYWWGGRVEVVVSNGRFVQLPRPDSLGRLSYNMQDTTFRARDAIEVRLRDIKKIGAVIDTALAHGISDISPVQFQALEASTMRDLALREATQDAKRQAEAIATSGGMRLGRVVSFNTQAEGGRYVDSGESGEGVVVTGLSMPGGVGATEVIPRALPVSVTVYAQWELLPKP
jgi:uncharacterized protein YggE